MGKKRESEKKEIPRPTHTPGATSIHAERPNEKIV